ncbi:MAG: hypothetical protein IPM35_32080 [Myxococcales bacterium]|nr:hypothetical protein [Myxococcales bacterium]
MQRLRLLALTACLFGAPAAKAAPPADLSSISSPREAYQRATLAWKAGDKEAAAFWFARADELEASDLALGSALRAAADAGLPVLSMLLAARAERAGTSAEVSTLAAKSRSKFGTSVGSVRVKCAGTSSCAVELDSAPWPEAGVVSLGEHRVSWDCPAGRETRTVTVTAGAKVEVDATCAEPAPLPAPPPSAPPASATPTPAGPAEVPPRSPTATPEPSRGLSPTWFWVGVGASVALGAASTWSGLDTRAKHDDFVSGGRTDAELEKDGKSAQTRTNVLFAATGIAALVTAGVGLFAVRWRSEGAHVAVTPIPSGATASVGVGF